ncbi:hypothetical protein Hanom_Chr05g00473981 [Helianthus anomalus]
MSTLVHASLVMDGLVMTKMTIILSENENHHLIGGNLVVNLNESRFKDLISYLVLALILCLDNRKVC